MDMTIVSVGIILVYITLVAELVFLPVPSVVSTYRLFSEKHGDEKIEGLRGEVSDWPVVRKVSLLLIPVIAGIAAFCVPLLLVFFSNLRNYLFPIQSLEHEVVIASGMVLMILGRGLSIYANLEIRSDNSQESSESKLITGGLFKRTRNPISVGMHITLLGMFLIFPSLVLLAGIICYMGNMHFRIVLEEDFLRREFPDRYDNYARKTKRYL